MAYSPLCSPGLHRIIKNDRVEPKHAGQNEIIESIAKKYGKTGAQVALKYLVGYAFIYLFGTFSLYLKSFKYYNNTIYL